MQLTCFLQKNHLSFKTLTCNLMFNSFDLYWHLCGRFFLVKKTAQQKKCRVEPLESYMEREEKLSEVKCLAQSCT